MGKKMTAYLTPTIIAEDRRLEAMSTQSSRDLMALRWHWTQNKDNPERVSFSAYAKSVGRNSTVITRYAIGYEILTKSGNTMTPDEAQERAAMTVETQTIVTAIAHARQMSIGWVRRRYQADIRYVREMARARIQEKPESTLQDHVPVIVEDMLRLEAEAIARERKEQERRKREQEANKAAHTTRFLIATGNIAHARMYLKKAREETSGVIFPEEESSLWIETLKEVQALVNDMVADADRSTRTGNVKHLRVV